MSVPAFADLLERLVFTPGRNAKLALLRRWFETQPDPERGLGLAALTDELVFTAAKPALVRDLAAARTDPVLLALSHELRSPLTRARLNAELLPDSPAAMPR